MVVGKPYIHFKVNNEPIEEVVDYNYTWATVVEAPKGPINTPTYIKAAEAASIGMNANKGSKNIDNKNNIAIVKLVRPVLPPSAIPAPDSTNVLTVEVPTKALKQVVTESAYIILL